MEVHLPGGRRLHLLLGQDLPHLDLLSVRDPE